MTEYSVEKFYNEYALKKEDSIIAVIDTGTNARKVCDLLNDQDKKIEELEKEKNSFMSDAIKFEKECKRLYNNLRLTNSDLCSEKIMHKHCKKENNKLKQTIKGAYEILSINVDVFSDKSLEQDSIAYKELQQLDNKDAYSIVRGIKGTIVLLKKRLMND